MERRNGKAKIRHRDRMQMMRPLKIAHRGGAALWPENTLFAFSNALKSGCDGIELDVQLTRDDQVIVLHDFHLKAEICRDGQGLWLASPGPLIKELTLAELQSFDIGRPKPGSDYERDHPDLTPRDGERIPTLREVLTLVRDSKNSLLLIEIKTNYRDRTQSAGPDVTAGQVISILRECGFLDRSILVGFDWTALIHAQKIEPSIRCWFTTPPPGERNGPALWADGFDPACFGDSIPKAIKAAGGKGWLANYRDSAPENIAEAHALGLTFAVWTVNDLDEMRALTAAGADVICTDRPDLVRQI